MLAPSPSALTTSNGAICAAPRWFSPSMGGGHSLFPGAPRLAVTSSRTFRSSFVVEAIKATRRENRNCRHERLRKKVWYLFDTLVNCNMFDSIVPGRFFPFFVMRGICLIHCLLVYNLCKQSRFVQLNNWGKFLLSPEAFSSCIHDSGAPCHRTKCSEVLILHKFQIKVKSCTHLFHLGVIPV